MTIKAQLKWGQTIWDDLTREELLRIVQKMYSVIQSQHSILATSRYGSENSPFWSKEGRGGAAFEKGRQVLESISEEEQEQLFRCFFRYAEDLLFEENGFAMIGSNWVVCDTCGTMGGTKREQLAGSQCNMCEGEPKGVMRKLAWSDMEAKPDDTV